MKDTTIVLFGATGDLANSRVLPAIETLWKKGLLGKNSLLIALGRKEFDSDTFMKAHNLSIPTEYVKRDIHSGRCEELRENILNSGNKHIIFYLSVSYEFFGKIVKNLIKCGINRIEGFDIKIMFEKPFGESFRSAKKLDKIVHSAFDEKDVYRVDHYLGKETIQNLLVLRFSNPLLENLWNKDFIDKITFFSDEDYGVGSRAEYYDKTGALKDMVQNHILQLVSFVLMDAPSTLDPDDVQNKKIEAIKSLKTIDAVFGQYEGYREEVKNQSSDTETFVGLNIRSRLKRWKGVPLIIRTGKMLPKKAAEIVIEFKKDPCILYCSPFTPPNRLFIKIQPKQDIVLEINSKVPGKFDVEKANLMFCQEGSFSGTSPEAYERLLDECIKGEKLLFPRFDEILESWKIIDKIERKKPTIYKKGQYPDSQA